MVVCWILIVSNLCRPEPEPEPEPVKEEPKVEMVEETPVQQSPQEEAPEQVKQEEGRLHSTSAFTVSTDTQTNIAAYSVPPTMLFYHFFCMEKCAKKKKKFH